MTPQDLAPFIEHSVLKPETNRSSVERGCAAAKAHGFRALCVPSGFVAQAKRLLGDSAVKVVSVVAFPHGTAVADQKVEEAKRAVALGADEIDYVISIGAALEKDWHYITQEARAIVRAARGARVKAILEIGYLPDQTRLEAAAAVVAGGAHYVKTCTGFGPGGVSAEDVKALSRALGDKALIKAAGGIRERWQAMEMLTAGAACIGTSAGPAIVAS